MKAFSFLLSLILVSVAVFSLILMSHEAGHGGCIVSFSAAKAPCAEKTDLINYINLHGDFLKKFAAPVFIFLLSLAGALALAVLFKLKAPPDLFLRITNFSPALFYREKVKFLAGRDFLSWLVFSRNIYFAVV